MNARGLIVLLSCQAFILTIVLMSNAEMRRISEVYTPPPEHCPQGPPDPFEVEQ